MHASRVMVNEWQQSSAANVYAAGEITGIGGLELSLAEGQIAGYAAAGKSEQARSLFAERANVDEVILRLQAAIDAPVRKDSRIETLTKAREQGRGHDNPGHER